MTKKKSSLADQAILRRAVRDTFRKLAFKDQIKNPVMFLVYVSAILTSALFLFSLFGISDGIVSSGFIFAITVILWLTDLFSNFDEAIAEGRGKAQADTIRANRPTLWRTPMTMKTFRKFPALPCKRVTSTL